MSRFSIGTKVYDHTAGKYGKVIKGPWFDGRENRYEVKHSGWVWSIPGSKLSTKHSRPPKLGGGLATRPMAIWPYKRFSE